MTDEKDTGDLDPSDWLASQFEETAAVPVQPPPAVPPAVPTPAIPPAVPPVQPPSAVPPAVPPPVPPVQQPHVPVVQPPPAVPPQVPPAPPPAFPPTAPPVAAPPPLVPPPAAPPPAAGGFSWGLTPGDTPPAPDASLPGPPEPEAPGIPTPDPFATQAMPIADVPTQALPGRDLETKQWEPWQARPIDSALDGATEVIEAEIIGLDGPEGESNPESPLDDLFGDSQFQDYEGEPLITGPPPGGPKPPKTPAQRIELTRVQKILLWVAGGLVAILVLIGLFLLGRSLGSTVAPEPVESASATPTSAPTVVVLPAGPIEPGDYRWDELLGGECLAPYESAWQETYTVVDCGTPHPGQLVFRGVFDDAADAPYPGFDELAKRTGLLCTAPTIINYQVAGTAQDIQVAASFAVDAADWDDGNRGYFCFANRSTGADLTASIAFPQPAITLAPTPAP